MLLKDHFKTLGLSPGATRDEIRKAYRKLAHEFHPDKNAGDGYAALHFQEIKEAYEVLTDPGRKERYLQQRWYQQSTGQRRTAEIRTPENILRQFIELERYVSRLDIYRMDRTGLQQYLLSLLSDEHLEVLEKFARTDINEQIAQLSLRAAKALPDKLYSPIAERLQKLPAGSDTSRQLRIDLIRRKRNAGWERYRIWMILLIVGLLCAAILFFS